MEGAPKKTAKSLAPAGGHYRGHYTGGSGRPNRQTWPHAPVATSAKHGGPADSQSRAESHARGTFRHPLHHLQGAADRQRRVGHRGHSLLSQVSQHGAGCAAAGLEFAERRTGRRTAGKAHDCGSACSRSVCWLETYSGESSVACTGEDPRHAAPNRCARCIGYPHKRRRSHSCAACNSTARGCSERSSRDRDVCSARRCHECAQQRAGCRDRRFCQTARLDAHRRRYRRWSSRRSARVACHLAGIAR